MTKKYYGNGKILLTGEYLVLDGARALALPTKFGQQSVIKENETQPGIIQWEAKEHDMVWFEATFDISTLKVLTSTNSPTASFITDMLLVVQEEMPAFKSFGSLSFEHSINFPLEWGLGSSSSLISNIAAWSGIDPFYLHHRVSAGSGYDVFSARSGEPIIFQVIDGQPLVEEVTFKPPFHKQLYFIYQGHKQSTAIAVEEFKNQNIPGNKPIERITKLTNNLLDCSNLLEFEKYIEDHERIVANAISKEPIGNTVFNDYQYGKVKSLGAWGGDFALFTLGEEHHPTVLIEYLKKKNLHTVFQYNDLILQQ